MTKLKQFISLQSHLYQHKIQLSSSKVFPLDISKGSTFEEPFPYPCKWNWNACPFICSAFICCNVINSIVQVRHTSVLESFRYVGVFSVGLLSNLSLFYKIITFFSYVIKSVGYYCTPGVDGVFF